MSPTDRNVSEAEIEATLSDPDIQPPGRQGTRIADKTMGDRKISVVYRRSEGDIIVITVVTL